MNTGFNLCMIEPGFFSDYFKIGNGCCQGDPSSPYLFLSCVEILGIIIRNNKTIKGININNKEYTL